MIFNALIIVALIPLALKGVRYVPMSAAALLLRRHLLIYGVGGLIVPFVGIKVIDMLLTLLGTGVSTPQHEAAAWARLTGQPPAASRRRSPYHSTSRYPTPASVTSKPRHRRIASRSSCATGRQTPGDTGSLRRMSAPRSHEANMSA